MIDFPTDRGNVIKVVETPEELVPFKSFIDEGYTAICEHKIPDTYDVFLQKIISSVYAWKSCTGGLAILCSKNDKPLCYGACLGYPSKVKTMLIYAVYSNRIQPRVVQDIMFFCEQRAKNFGCQELVAHTGRFSKHVYKWFEDKMGFSRHHITFKKEI